MTFDDLAARLKCDLFEPIDVDGVPITELDGLKLKPMSVADTVAVVQYGKAHGDERQYQLAFARGVVNPDGSRIMTDEDAPKIADFLNHPAERAFFRLQQLSNAAGMKRGKDGEKKTPSTTTSS